MRTVLNSDEIAYYWTRNVQEHARSHANMSFSGDKFYSYNTVIAARIRQNGDRPVYLVSTTKYSSSTSAHVGLVRQNIPKGARVFNVPGVQRGGYGFEDFARILKDWTLEARRLIDDAARARDPKRTRLIIEAYRLRCTMRVFANHFGLSLDGYTVEFPMAEAEIVKTINRIHAEAPQARKDREERASMARVMRRLHPGEKITAAAVYKAWQVAKKSATAIAA